MLDLLKCINWKADEMKKISILLVVLAGSLWGFMGLFVRKLNEYGLASMDIVALRAIITLILMVIFLTIYNRKLFKVKLKDVWCFLGTGILSILFFNFCYFKAITLTTLPVAAVLLYTAPAIVTVLSAILFKEKITKLKVGALALTFVGCVLTLGFTGSSIDIKLVGILFGLGAGFGYALYSIFSRYAIIRGYHSFTISLYTFLIASIATIPFANMNRIKDFAFDSSGNVLFIIVFGMVSTVLPYIFYNFGLKGLDNSKASIIASIEPVVASVVGVFIYDEKLVLSQIIGISLVLVSIIMCNINIRKMVEKGA